MPTSPQPLSAGSSEKSTGLISRVSAILQKHRLAHSSFNTTGYSWMLVGDDDTVFVTQNVLRMLRGLQLDPSVPYILTDDQGSALPPQHPPCTHPYPSPLQ